MHANLAVGHQGLPAAQVASRLVKAFGDHDPQALVRSPVFSTDYATWQSHALYSRDSADYRIVCLQSSATELQAVVEPTRGDLKKASQSVWDGLRTVFRDAEPDLLLAEIIDRTTGRAVLQASSTFIAHARSRETLTLLLVGLVSVAFLVVGVLSFAASYRGEFVGGGTPGLLSSVVGLVLAMARSRKGELTWR